MCNCITTEPLIWINNSKEEVKKRDAATAPESDSCLRCICCKCPVLSSTNFCGHFWSGRFGECSYCVCESVGNPRKCRQFAVVEGVTVTVEDAFVLELYPQPSTVISCKTVTFDIQLWSSDLVLHAKKNNINKLLRNILNKNNLLAYYLTSLVPDILAIIQFKKDTWLKFLLAMELAIGIVVFNFSYILHGHAIFEIDIWNQQGLEYFKRQTNVKALYKIALSVKLW